MRMTVPPSVLELDRSGIASQPTEATKPRTRSGLLGFFRPQKTVSPLTHQAAQDVSVAVKKQTLAAGSCPARASRDPGDETEPCSAWSTLPEHLIESIMQMLQTNLPAPLHHNNKAERQTQFAVTSVSKNWRQIGRRAFFKCLWDTSGAIQHPVQLFGLSPETEPNQLVKCVMKREYNSSQKRAVKYTLKLGDRLSNSTFLMTALQVSRLDIKLYLTSSCSGTPCARIETNLLGTKYEVVLDSTVQPFAQHQATHSHTPPKTFAQLPSMEHPHSMQSAPSAGLEFDVPVVDLSSTSGAAFAPVTPSLSDQTYGRSNSGMQTPSDSGLAPNACLRSAASGSVSQLEDDTLSDLPHSGLASPAASSGFLNSFLPSTQAQSKTACQSPFAAVASTPHQHPFGAKLLPGSPAATTSFLAKCKPATEAASLGRAQSGANPPLMNPSSSSPFTSFLARSWSDRADGRSPAEGNCENDMGLRCTCQAVPRTVGGVQYKTRIRGFMRPRRMKVNLPDPLALACFDTSASGSCCSRTGSEGFSNRLPSSLFVADEFTPTPEQTGMKASPLESPCTPDNSQVHLQDQYPSPDSSLASTRSSLQQMTLCSPTLSQTDSQFSVSPSKPYLPSQKGVELRNKPPHWNDTLRCWCLNFRGRVKLASVKNFQLIKADDPNKAIVMQFGKVDATTYIMDYNPAEITAIQAFAISLSTFDTKLLL